MEPDRIPPPAQPDSLRRDRAAGDRLSPAALDTAPPDAVTLRAALGTFATGVTVVTAAIDGHPVLGMTVNSFSAVSLDPPLILWSLRKSSASLHHVRAAPGFVVNVLADDQHPYVERFARPADDRFEGIAWSAGRHGPILHGAIAHFDCEHYAQYDVGDHLVLIGKVHACHSADGVPLVYWRGRRN